MKNTSISPMWGDLLTLKGGENHLGMVNACEQMYSKLLPGVRNLTKHIRYYSFYCWIIDNLYKQKASSSIDYKTFRYHVRKCEYLMALINIHGNEPVPGNNHASKEYPYYNKFYLRNGSEEYWAAPTGVLGQYYATALFEMGIVAPNVNETRVYNISKDGNFIKGREISEIFQKRVAKTSDLFWECISKEEVSKDELDELSKDFIVTGIDDEESDILLKMLLQKDMPTDIYNVDTYHRKETIKLLLQYVKENPFGVNISVTDFTNYVYKFVLNNPEQFKDDKVVLGWYFYHLCDAWQFNATIILEKIVAELVKSGPTDVQDICSIIADELLQSPLDQYGENALNDVITKIGNSPQGPIDSLLLMYRENKGNRDLLKTVLSSFGGISPFNIREFFSFVDDNLNTKFNEFVQKLILKFVIIRHCQVSIRKYGQTGDFTQKFMLEDDKLTATMDNVNLAPRAGRTSPRIASLMGYLRHLGLVDANHITQKGLNKLKELQ